MENQKSEEEFLSLQGLGCKKMDSRACMNEVCGASSSSSTSIEWKKGWPLRSGGFATLCAKCGTAFEQLVFCEMFHSKETGWRKCNSCDKRLHCGCVVSSSLLELLDTGGVNCIGCCRSSKPHSVKPIYTPTQEKSELCAVSNADSISGNHVKMARTQSGDDAQNDCQKLLLPSGNDDPTVSLGPMKLEEGFPASEEIGHKLVLNFNQASTESSQNIEAYKAHVDAKTVHKSLIQTNLSIALSASANANPSNGVVADERESSISSFHQGCRPRHLFQRPPSSILSAGLETNSSTISQLRVARPPVEGRVKNQLLPRYWPRITDKELQQISGDSNSTIVPLFEKVLSASDAGRIGRLVLPKACAEAYFPPISQPEGLPLRIQDVKGKEWVFQFRFWPNNNSRMYVLEGVTPCIQSMQLQAGDTVTFSRMDPEGKLLMGFRKASSTISVQDSHLSALYGGVLQNEPLLASAENLPVMSGYSGILQSLKGSRNSSINMPSKHFYGGNLSPLMSEKNGSKSGDGMLPQSLPLPERKRSRNISSKSKRLHIDSQDALELKLSWEEVQDMLRPPLSVKPSTVTIEDHEFEEFEEPPVFGKMGIFTVRVSGDEQEQWAQCDSCFKWRRLPVDILLPPKWTCQDNVWDQTRCSCSAPDELGARELENLLKMNSELKKRRFATSHRSAEACESAVQEALVNAASVGGDMSEPGASSVATTTKHPRHRPGCSCIVCIQPPSGKGKHKPTCVCNVCMTVKRRFKTLMMRKKKRQSEREAEIASKNQFVLGPKEEAEVESVPSQSDNEKRSGSELFFRCQDNSQSQENAEMHKGGLDLNCCPDRENVHTGSLRVSMMSLLQEASLPLDTYLRQNGLTSLASVRMGSPRAPEESETRLQEESVPAAVVQEDQDGNDELSESDRSENDTS
ncbi:B3 domain-containing transcription repressor VAL2-like isoform X1 [Olea europaea var. sylvestris]|uniref:B3 domain-containing transcription repressor VAL2-like isoform X1 n=1 Tax=Olea europaea var. sylvestris TaxID=158386 RepID=UPI000C1CD096|nr:B3 domain-containing transcription repressor VAL2-like isoform X1 [Olea europaea var. sylvestris]